MANTYFTRSDVLVRSVDEAGYSFETVTVALASGLKLGSVLIDPEGDLYPGIAAKEPDYGQGLQGDKLFLEGKLYCSEYRKEQILYQE